MHSFHHLGTVPYENHRIRWIYLYRIPNTNTQFSIFRNLDFTVVVRILPNSRNHCMCKNSKSNGILIWIWWNSNIQMTFVFFSYWFKGALNELSNLTTHWTIESHMHAPESRPPLKCFIYQLLQLIHFTFNLRLCHTCETISNSDKLNNSVISKWRKQNEESHKKVVFAIFHAIVCRPAQLHNNNIMKKQQLKADECTVYTVHTYIFGHLLAHSHFIFALKYFAVNIIVFVVCIGFYLFASDSFSCGYSKLSMLYFIDCIHTSYIQFFFLHRYTIGLNTLPN